MRQQRPDKKGGKKQKGDSVEARGNRWRITGGEKSQFGKQSGGGGGRRGGLAVRVSLMKHS